MGNSELTFLSALRSMGIAPDAVQQSALRDYASLVVEWNSKVNLISRKDQETIWSVHLIHSLSLLSHLEIPTGLHVLDLGTGGGLPGIPLAIMRPDLHFTLVDSIRKKILAVEDMVSRLPISNVHVINARAEEIRAQHRDLERPNIVIARAVAPLTDLLTWSRTLVKKGGEKVKAKVTEATWTTPLLISMKGGDLEEELHQAQLRYPRAKPAVLPIRPPDALAEGLQDKKLVLTELSLIL